MTSWTSDELERVGQAGELTVAGLKHDGTLRRGVTIWQVRAGEAIYIRSVNGPEASWFRGTQLRGEGQVSAGGVTKDVAFVRVDDDPTLAADVDAAYRAKYGTGSAVQAITSAAAASTTMRVDPA